MTEHERMERIRSEALPIPDGFEERHDALLSRLIQERRGPIMRRKIPIALMAALLVLLLAFGLAVAAGLGVFGRLAGRHEATEAQLANLESAAESYGAETVIAAADGRFPETRFTVTQAYYDGKSLYIAYTVCAPATVVEYLSPDKAEGIPWDITPEDRTGRDWAAVLSPGDYAAFERRLAEDGRLLVRSRMQGLDGGAYLSDGTYIRPGKVDFQVLADGGAMGYIEFEHPLPEAARNQDALTVTLTLLRSEDIAYLEDLHGYASFQHGAAVEPVRIPVTVRRNSRSATLTGGGSFDGYDAFATAIVSDVDVKVECRVTGALAEEWLRAWEEEEPLGDALSHFNLYSGGVRLRLADQLTDMNDDAGEGDIRFFLGFDLPESHGTLELRPEFRHTGEHSEDTITLR